MDTSEECPRKQRRMRVAGDSRKVFIFSEIKAIKKQKKFGLGTGHAAIEGP